MGTGVTEKSLKTHTFPGVRESGTAGIQPPPPTPPPPVPAPPGGARPASPGDSDSPDPGTLHSAPRDVVISACHPGPCGPGSPEGRSALSASARFRKAVEATPPEAAAAAAAAAGAGERADCGRRTLPSGARFPLRGQPFHFSRQFSDGCGWASLSLSLVIWKVDVLLILASSWS
ncbi:unnamed protein product [Rangifer tarandus platyrhynchus]|uniref:Uncharacterized protein n=1 Tax=Rangifer tarandus platyrhynchus TaxID=3082113 RepID=A0ABN8YJ86_RANTA|nr:unnamed protein product [Rangifer tarandus platyrhynchus]